MNKQKIVIPSGIGLVPVLQFGQLSWLVKLWPAAGQKSLNFTYAFKCYQQNCSWLHFTWTTLYYI